MWQLQRERAQPQVREGLHYLLASFDKQQVLVCACIQYAVRTA
jgi:hypothetical protein